MSHAPKLGGTKGKSRRLSRHPQDGHPGRCGSLLTGVQHLSPDVGKEAEGNTELEIEYEKILNRVKQTRESVIKMTDRHFTAPVDEISGTVDEVSPHGISLEGIPGPDLPVLIRVDQRRRYVGADPGRTPGLFILPHNKTLTRTRATDRRLVQ